MHFFISYAVAFLVFGLIGKWYIWPKIKDRALKPALTPLLLYACLRVNGLMFLMPGLPFAVPMLWLFNTVGLLDLIYANISTFKDQVDPSELPTIWRLSMFRPWCSFTSSSSLIC